MRISYIVPSMHTVAGAALAFSLLSLIGCGKVRLLRVDVDPKQSRVELVGRAGSAPVTGEAPLVTKVQFKDGSGEVYHLTVLPPAGREEAFLHHEQTLSQSEYEQLNGTDELGRTLSIKLAEKKFIELHSAEIFVSRGRWRGWLTSSRAWQDIAEAGGQVPTRVIDFKDLAIQGVALSPTGDRIVFSTVDFGRPLVQLAKELGDNPTRDIPIKGCNLQGVNVAGGGLQQITQEDHRDMYPFFAPDGQRLMFSSNRRNQAGADLLSISAAGKSGISNIYIDSREGLSLYPSIANDGTITFALVPKDSDDSYVWTVGGNNQFPTQVTTGTQPRISPDGKRIVFIGPDKNLWVVDSTGTNQMQLTFNGVDIVTRYKKSLSELEQRRLEQAETNGVQVIMPYAMPSWSADGTALLYAGMDGNDPTGRPNADIWYMNVDGSDRQQLTTNGSQDTYPLMSPDGKSIYFVSNRGKQWGIWRIAAPEAATKNVSPAPAGK